MKKINFLFLILCAVMLFSGCAHTENVSISIPTNEHIYGFWGGTWHGMILPFSFISSLFNDKIVIYAINNNGHWYDFGFIGGLFFILKCFKFIFKAIAYIFS
jgi:hypothetical protein